MKAVVKVLAVVVLSAWSWSAAAEAVASGAAANATDERARSLFKQGQALLEQGQISRACESFEESLALKQGIGTKFNLATCFEKLGKTASAHALFVDVVEATRLAGQAERALAARARVQALEPKLSRLVLQVQSPSEGLEVRRDGELLPKESWDQPIAVDPGKHEISARAPGKKPLRVEIEVPVGPVLMPVVVTELQARDSAEAQVVAAAPGSSQAVGSRPVSSPSVTSAERSAEPSDRFDARESEAGPSTGRRVLTYGLAGVGVIGVAVGATMGQQFYSSNEKAKDVCPSGRNCSDAEISEHAALRQDAKEARTWSWVGTGVGVAALGTALALWLTEPDDDSQARVHAVPWFDTASLGGSISGSF